MIYFAVLYFWKVGKREGVQRRVCVVNVVIVRIEELNWRNWCGRHSGTEVGVE